MEIMDLLYEEDTISPLFTTSSDSLAAAILVCVHFGWQIFIQTQLLLFSIYLFWLIKMSNFSASLFREISSLMLVCMYQEQVKFMLEILANQLLGQPTT